MGRDRIGTGKKYGARMIFIQDKPSYEANGEQYKGTPKAVLFGDRRLEVDAFLSHREEKARPIKYGGVCMWSLAAVGYRE